MPLLPIKSFMDSPVSLTQMCGSTLSATMLPWLQAGPWYSALAAFLKKPSGQCWMLSDGKTAAPAFAVALMTDTLPGRLQSLSNYYSPLAGPQLPEGATPWQQFSEALGQQLPQCSELRLSPVKQSQLPPALLPHWRWHCQQISSNWTAQTEDYWQRRPAQLRNTVRRKTSKLLAAGGHWQIYRQINPSLREAYWQVYQRSWKPSEPSPDFIDSLFDIASAQGSLRLGVLWLDDKPVAVQCWLVAAGTAAIYKLAQDQSCDHWSPGTVLTGVMVDEVLASDNVSEIDFLTGNDSYKALWMDQINPLYQLTLYRRDSWPAQWNFHKARLVSWLAHLKATIDRYGAADAER